MEGGTLQWNEQLGHYSITLSDYIMERDNGSLNY